MPVTPEEVADQYPVLYHMAAPGSWPLIAKYGLHCTSSLLDLFGIEGEERRKIEEMHRPESVVITHPERGAACVRDQKPMDDRGLERALDEVMTPRDWYRILNAKAFFWVREERLRVMMSARAYRDQAKTVLYVATVDLLARHADRVLLAPMNTGCTKPWPHPRGPKTFAPIAEYPYDERRRKKGADAIVELAVEGCVPDIEELVIKVEEVQPSNEVEVIFQR